MPRKSGAVVGIGVGLEDIWKKNQKVVGTHDENMPDMIPIKTIQSSTK